MATDPVALVKSSSAKDRKRGIKMIAQMQNEKAVKVLVQIAKKDDDPEVRAMAEKGAKLVARKLKEQEAEEPEHVSPFVETDDAYDEKEPAEPETPREYVVSEADKEKANGYINEALDQQMIGKKDKAMQALSKALNANPNLRNDTYFTSVAGSVTGLGALEAINALENSDRRKNLVQEARKRKQADADQEHMATAEKHTWGTAMVDVAILSAIVLVGTILAVMVFGSGATRQINNLQAVLGSEDIQLSSEERDAVEDQLATAERFAAAFTFPIALILAVITWFSLVMGILVFVAIGHLVAKHLMSGSGTMPYLLYKIIQAHNIPMLVIYAGVVLGAMLIFFAGAPSGIIIFGLTGLTVLVSLAILFRIIGAIGGAYNFGLGKALVTAALAGIGYNTVMSAAGFAISIVAGGVVTTIMSVTG